MKKVGPARRIVKGLEEVQYLWIPIYYSEEDHRYHRVLPDTLVPYKHYDLDTIALAAKDRSEFKSAFFTSRASIARWNKWVRELLNGNAEPKLSASSSSLPNKLHHSDASGSSADVPPDDPCSVLSLLQLEELIISYIRKRL